MSAEVMDDTRRIAEALCRDERVLLHAQALPNVGSLRGGLEGMEEAVERYPIVAWKTFTHFPDVFEGGDRAWWFDDHEPGIPKVAMRSSIRRAARRRQSRPQGVSAQPVRLAAELTPEGAPRRRIRISTRLQGGVGEGRTRARRGTGGQPVVTTRRGNGSVRTQCHAELGSTWWITCAIPQGARAREATSLRRRGPRRVWTDALLRLAA